MASSLPPAKLAWSLVIPYCALPVLDEDNSLISLLTIEVAHLDCF